jgi:hypothetical protein
MCKNSSMWYYCSPHGADQKTCICSIFKDESNGLDMKGDSEFGLALEGGAL